MLASVLKTAKSSISNKYALHIFWILRALIYFQLVCAVKMGANQHELLDKRAVGEFCHLRDKSRRISSFVTSYAWIQEAEAKSPKAYACVSHRRKGCHSSSSISADAQLGARLFQGSYIKTRSPKRRQRGSEGAKRETRRSDLSFPVVGGVSFPSSFIVSASLGGCPFLFFFLTN